MCEVEPGILDFSFPQSHMKHRDYCLPALPSLLLKKECFPSSFPALPGAFDRLLYLLCANASLPEVRIGVPPP